MAVSALQSSVDVLPEESRVAGGLGPAQVGAPPHQLPHAVVRRQLLLWQLFQEEQDQHIFLLIQQTVAGDGTHHHKVFKQHPSGHSDRTESHYVKGEKLPLCIWNVEEIENI